MWRNRLLYLFVLLCTTSFFICFNGYYSWYVFLLSLALPWLSLLLSLPGMLTTRAMVEIPGAAGVVRTGKSAALPLQVSAASRWPLPSGRVRVRLTATNTFTGDTRREVLELSPGREPQAVEHRLSSHACGRVVCQLSKARGYDLLGLFWLPVRLKKGGCQVIVQPNVFEAMLALGPRQAQDQDGDRYSPVKPGSDPTELFGLRDYRPGDKLSRVDWKLSQKTGGMLVREASLPMARRSLLLVDLFGEAMEADLLMDALASLSHWFCCQGAQYAVGFRRGGGLAFLEVDDPEEGPAAVEAVLCHSDRGPFPASWPSLGQPAGAPQDIARVVYLCPEPEAAAMDFVLKNYPGVRLTVIHTRALTEEKALPPEANPVQVRQGFLQEDLEGLTL